MIDVFKLLKDRIQGKAPKGAKRSPDWRDVRKAHLNHHPNCACCGSSKKVEVHHIVPFHVAPDQELNPNNLISLCENKKYGINCHLLLGHLGNYRNINPSVVGDVMYIGNKIGKVQWEQKTTQMGKFIGIKMRKKDGLCERCKRN
jgi:hypothetical protein